MMDEDLKVELKDLGHRVTAVETRQERLEMHLLGAINDLRADVRSLRDSTHTELGAIRAYAEQEDRAQRTQLSTTALEAREARTLAKATGRQAGSQAGAKWGASAAGALVGIFEIAKVIYSALK